MSPVRQRGRWLSEGLPVLAGAGDGVWVSYMHAMRLENVNLMEKMRAAVEAARESEP